MTRYDAGRMILPSDFPSTRLGDRAYHNLQAMYGKTVRPIRSWQQVADLSDAALLSRPDVGVKQLRLIREIQNRVH
jgi:hypothetical protein